MSNEDYEQQLFYNLEHNIPDFRWYTIEKDRKDRLRFIETIKKRIDIYGDFEFNDDYSKFRKIEPYNPDNYSGISIKIDFHEQTEEFNWDHLPKTEPPKMDHKAWEKRKGRAV